MAATEMPPMDMTVAVQGLVNLFLNMDGKSREMFIKLLVVKMEEEEVDFLLQVVDTRNLSPDDLNNISVKKDDIKIETDHSDNDSNYGQNYESETNDTNTEHEDSLFTLNGEMSKDNKMLSKETNNENEFKCVVCEYSFFNQRGLKRHLATHPEYKEEKVKKPIMCDICPKSFFSINDLKSHKNLHDGIKPFLCDQCPYSSGNKKLLKRHTQKYHIESNPGYICETFICDFCSKTYTDSENFKSHVRQHTKEKLFKCDQCDFKAFKLFNLNEHKRTHTGERPFACNICTKTFINKAHLKRHIKGVHMGEKLITPGEKNYLCDLCSLGFSAPQALSLHKKSIHEGIKYDCDQCEYKATERGNLARHVAAVHEGIKFSQECLCQKCGYKASSKQNLRIHEESVHLGIRHECSQCDHKAMTKANLVVHVASVHESIQHDCKECGFTTFKKRAFLKHKTEHKKAQELQNQTLGLPME